MKSNLIKLISIVYGLVQAFLIAVKVILINNINQQLGTVQMQIDGVLKYNTYISVINGTFCILTLIVFVSYIILLLILRRMINEKVH